MRKRVEAKWDKLSENTKFKPRNRECQGDTESTRQARLTWQQHTNETRISPGGFKELHCKRTHPFHTEMKQKTQVWDQWGETPEGGEAHPKWSVIHQLWQSCGHMGMFWQGAKSFMGGAGRGPCAASADLWGRLSQGYGCAARKSAEIFTGHLDKGGGGQLSTGQHRVG